MPNTTFQNVFPDSVNETDIPLVLLLSPYPLLFFFIAAIVILHVFA